jgi:tRNA nucleotidyltransferase (CCA-adding enzyme)
MTIISSFEQPIHPLAVEICRVLQTAGHQAYIVGGCVRDLYLNLAPKDWDITTDATPEKVIELFPRTIPTGLQHGTVTVCMGEGTENHFEVTTFRVEGQYLDGRRPEQVKFVNSITEDLARRDLTINAMAYDPVSHIGRDPFNGFQDIQTGIIRAVGNPVARFQEDGLRIMRVARFAARFGYQVEPNTVQGMKDNLETLKKVSKERISDELRKILTSAHPFIGMDMLKYTGALRIICPLLKEEIIPLFPLNAELETQLALLYHNFWGNLAKQDLLELKFSNSEIKKVCFLLDMLTAFRILVTGKTSTANYTKFMARFKNESPSPWEQSFQQFIELASVLELPIREMLLNYYDVVVWARKELAINGDDLMAQGIKAGPNLKILLDKCYLEILREPNNNNKSYLIDFVKENMDK